MTTTTLGLAWSVLLKYGPWVIIVGLTLWLFSGGELSWKKASKKFVKMLRGIAYAISNACKNICKFFHSVNKPVKKLKREMED